MLKRDQIILLYEYFYRDFTGNSKFRFNHNLYNLNLIDSFEKLLDHRHGEIWLFHYFGFQFQIRSTQKINPHFMGGRVKIMLNWIIGKKAFDIYQKSSDQQKYYGDEYIKNRCLSNPLLKASKVEEFKDLKDIERRRFFNTDLGLIHCIELNLFDRSSKYCITCKNKKICTSVEIK